MGNKITSHTGWCISITNTWDLFYSLPERLQEIIRSYLDGNILYYRHNRTNQFIKAPSIDQNYGVAATVINLNKLFRNYKSTTYVDISDDIYSNEGSWIFWWSSAECILIDLLEPTARAAYIDNIKQELTRNYKSIINYEINEELKRSRTGIKPTRIRQWVI